MLNGRIRRGLIVGTIVAVCLGSGHASAQGVSDRLGLGDLFGLGGDDRSKITMSGMELQSLGCLAAGAAVGAAAVLFGGAAIIVTRGQGAAAATTVAVPVLATTMWAGCSVGSQMAPGVAWLRRNSEALFGKVVNALPAEPLAKVLPGKHE